MKKRVSSTSRVVFFLSACLAFAFSGCERGLKLAPVTGLVLMDGKPVEGAGVLFTPVKGGRPADGVTDKDGRFQLQTFKPGDGAPIGKHIVTVIGMRMTGSVATEDGLEGAAPTGKSREVWFVPKRYSVLETSGLEAEVKRGLPPLKFELAKN